jgi:hypothetical protein
MMRACQNGIPCCHVAQPFNSAGIHPWAVSQWFLLEHHEPSMDSSPVRHYSPRTDESGPTELYPLRLGGLAVMHAFETIFSDTAR